MSSEHTAQVIKLLQVQKVCSIGSSYGRVWPMMAAPAVWTLTWDLESCMIESSRGRPSLQSPNWAGWRTAIQPPADLGLIIGPRLQAQPVGRKTFGCDIPLMPNRLVRKSIFDSL